MRLFRAFDEVENMLAEGRSLRIERDEIEALLLSWGFNRVDLGDR